MTLVDLPEIVAEARRVRLEAGLSEPPYSTQAIVDKCFPDVMVTGGSLPRGVAEMVLAEGTERTVLYNRRVGPPAQRVAIAHALGHLVFDDRLRSPHRFTIRPTSNEHVERRADLFAGELLVPLADLDPAFAGSLFPKGAADRHVFDDSVDQVSSWFNVPVGFLRWRLWDLLHLRRTNFYLESPRVKK